MAEKRVVEVAVTVSKPFILVGGGWTTQCPLGKRREYRAVVDGVTFRNLNKAEIQDAIRTKVFRASGASVRFTFQEEA